MIVYMYVWTCMRTDLGHGCHNRASRWFVCNYDGERHLISRCPRCPTPWAGHIEEELTRDEVEVLLVMRL